MVVMSHQEIARTAIEYIEGAATSGNNFDYVVVAAPSGNDENSFEDVAAAASSGPW